MAITPPWALHVGARNCFNRPTAFCMATTATPDDIFLTLMALDGQVVPFREYSTNATFTGTDCNNGGCAAGYLSLTEGSKNWRNHNEKNAW
jgi:hypothetical protein